LYDGLRLGFSEGFKLGSVLMLGRDDGRELGVLLGTSDGDRLGLAEGLLVGAIDGTVEWIFEGELLGDVDGEMVGDLVGRGVAILRTGGLVGDAVSSILQQGSRQPDGRGVPSTGHASTHPAGRVTPSLGQNVIQPGALALLFSKSHASTHVAGLQGAGVPSGHFG
jgi:hypothetical protein